MCASVTGVRRGPVRRTEFKFQIWSVSLGVTVCIALPAGPNSLRADRSSLLSPTASPYIRPSIHLPSLPLSPPAPRGRKHPRSTIFHIIQIRERRGAREKIGKSFILHRKSPSHLSPLSVRFRSRAMKIGRREIGVSPRGGGGLRNDVDAHGDPAWKERENGRFGDKSIARGRGETDE